MKTARNGMEREKMAKNDTLQSAKIIIPYELYTKFLPISNKKIQNFNTFIYGISGGAVSYYRHKSTLWAAQTRGLMTKNIHFGRICPGLGWRSCAWVRFQKGVA
ncbi:MAG: hypothetical protein AAFV95_22975 [Bacteroidota bacterium]